MAARGDRYSGRDRVPLGDRRAGPYLSEAAHWAHALPRFMMLP